MPAPQGNTYQLGGPCDANRSCSPGGSGDNLLNTDPSAPAPAMICSLTPNVRVAAYPGNMSYDALQADPFAYDEAVVRAPLQFEMSFKVLSNQYSD